MRWERCTEITGSFSDGQCLAKHGMHVLVSCNYQSMHSEQLAHKNPKSRHVLCQLQHQAIIQ